MRRDNNKQKAGAPMQNPPALPPRLKTLLTSPPGRRIASICAISSLACLTISLLLGDFTRLAWPFVVASFVLAVFGCVSHSRRTLVRMVLALWVIQANAILTSALNQFDLGAKPTTLYQQTQELESQANHMWPQLMNLYFQEGALQQALKDKSNVAQADVIQANLQSVQDEINAFYTQDTYGNLADVIIYNEYLLQNDARNFPTNAILQYMQDQIGSNATLIKQNRQVIQKMDSIVNAASSIFPDLAGYMNPVPSAAMNCTMFPCLENSTWGQIFVTGWQNIASRPLSVTWPFWLGLFLSLVLWCFFLPRWQDPLWVLTYRRRYFGPLAGLRDKALPAELEQEYSPETTVVTIEVNSSKLFSKQSERTDGPRELLRLSLGAGTSIQRLSLGNTPADAQAEVELDRNTGEVVLKMHPQQLMTKFPKNTTLKERMSLARARRRFPVQIYVVVDTFAGTITATTPIAEVERLEERRGLTGLSILGALCHQLAWWVLVTGLFLVLETCSHLFFAGLNAVSQPKPLYIAGLSLFGAFLLFLTLEIIIARATTHRQKLQREPALV